LHVSHRPLAIVSGLTIGDYLLWNWSLNGSHDVLALVSGLTLPPLAAAFVWLIALTGARLLARTTRRQGTRKPSRARATAGTATSIRAAFARARGNRRAAWLGELRAANGKPSGKATTSRSRQPSASGSRAPSATQASATAPSQAQQPPASKRSGPSRKIAA
jgi:hypothetical protein